MRTTNGLDTLPRLLGVIGLLALLPARAPAQGNGGMHAGASDYDQAYRVGPGDVLEVEVFDDPDLSGLVTIQYGGEISFPLLGDIKVEGLTVKEVQQTLTAMLAKDYLVDPQVSVRVKEHRSQWVTLVGEAVRPGKYFLQGSKSLLDLLTEAGGFTPQASGEVIVSRQEDPALAPEDGDGHRGAIRILLSPEQPPAQQKEALSLQLKSGDIVTATSTQFFYVSGEVKNPGSFALTPGLTVLKAVSVAGGLGKFGSKGKVEILRKLPNGETTIVKVDLGDIEDGKKPDVPVHPQDIIKVGKRVF
jgi:polysaccharide export outer membrane protein